MTDYLKNQTERKSELLAQTFAAWEKNLRGWSIFDFAVNLEPVFGSIKPPPLPEIRPVHDDARIQNGLSRLFGRANPSDRQTDAVERVHIVSRQSDDNFGKPLPFYRSEPLSELNVLLPMKFEVSTAVCEQFLLSLSSFPTPLSFEILADSVSIKIQTACDRSLAVHLKNQIQTFFPNCVIGEKQGVLQNCLTDHSRTAIADFGLARSFLRPLQTFRNFNPDPLTGLISSLGGLQTDETAVFQIVFQKAKGNWAEEVQRIFNNPNLKTSLSSQAPLLREKFSSPLFAVLIRLAVESPNKAQSWQILRRIGGNLSQFSIPNGNELIALSNDGLSDNNHFLSVLNRTSYRHGMLLNTAELAALTHFPADSVQIEKLRRDHANTKAVPKVFLNKPFGFGTNRHQNDRYEVTLSEQERLKHTHLIGASGSGKSTLLLQMMLQDLNAGDGFACFDPHGDLIDSVLERVPPSRLNDVILFSPDDEDYPIGFNILSAHSELEKTLLASDLVAIFRRFSTSWGDVMNSILANAVLAFLENSRGGSLIDLKRFLIERAFREEFLQTVADEEIRYYWQTEFPTIKGKPFVPLLTRLDTFLRSKLIRHIVAQKENRLDLRRIMDERKILLVRLSLGAIGQENAYLLGSLLVSKIYHAALSRQNVASDVRPPFFLYLDEAHHFITESMEQILSGVRKYKLGLVLAHQQLRQFQAGEADILASALANCYTRICFRLDDADAERLARGFSFFTADHLKNLGVGEAICRFEQSQFDFNLKTFPLEEVPPAIAEQRKRAVIERTRKLYGRPKTEIEAENQRPPIAQTTVESLRPEQIISAEKLTTEVIEKEPSALAKDVFNESDESVTNTQGRGSRHHQELQNLIKRMAESYGFAVEIEKSILGGTGFVDVSLEKEGWKIAVEVSVSTLDYEVNNVLKGLSAGYERVLVVASNGKKIPVLKSKIRSALPFESEEKVKVLNLSELLVFLRSTEEIQTHSQKPEKATGQRLDLTEASEFLGISVSTLYRWAREGRIPFYRLGREYRFDRDELVLIGKHDLSGKRKATVKLKPLTIDKTAPKSKKEQDKRYRKMLKMD